MNHLGIQSQVSNYNKCNWIPVIGHPQGDTITIENFVVDTIKVITRGHDDHKEFAIAISFNAVVIAFYVFMWGFHRKLQNLLAGSETALQSTNMFKDLKCLYVLV